MGWTTCIIGLGFNVTDTCRAKVTACYINSYFWFLCYLWEHLCLRIFSGFKTYTKAYMKSRNKVYRCYANVSGMHECLHMLYKPILLATRLWRCAVDTVSLPSLRLQWAGCVVARSEAHKASRWTKSSQMWPRYCTEPSLFPAPRFPVLTIF